MILLDGGLATELEHRGHDLSSDLWSARLLAEQPDEIRAVHAAYFAAGARVATTASYQASYEGLAAVGHSPAAADALLRRSVTLARRRRGREPRPPTQEAGRAGSQPPSGLTARCWPAARSTPATTDPAIGVPELRAWHRPRLEVLASAGPDVAGAGDRPVARRGRGPAPRGGRPRGPGVAVADLRRDPDAARRGRLRGLRHGSRRRRGRRGRCELHAPAGRGRPGRARSGGLGQARRGLPQQRGDLGRRRRGCGAATPASPPDDVVGWVEGGARLVGGCCRVGPDEIRSLAQLVGPGR